MEFLQTVINSNRERTCMPYRMNKTFNDGFSLNFMSVMQQLAVRVKVNQVSIVRCISPIHSLVYCEMHPSNTIV